VVEDLVRWLGAQLDTDERVANEKLCINCGNHTAPLESPIGITGYTHAGGHANEQGEWEREWEGRRCPGSLLGATPVQDPARVLREIDSKRQMLDRYEELRAESKKSGLIGDVTEEYQDFLLRLLALPYADRPGYREEWAP